MTRREQTPIADRDNVETDRTHEWPVFKVLASTARLDISQSWKDSLLAHGPSRICQCRSIFLFSFLYGGG